MDAMLTANNGFVLLVCRIHLDLLELIITLAFGIL